MGPLSRLRNDTKERENNEKVLTRSLATKCKMTNIVFFGINTLLKHELRKTRGENIDVFSCQAFGSVLHIPVLSYILSPLLTPAEVRSEDILVKSGIYRPYE